MKSLSNNLNDILSLQSNQGISKSLILEGDDSSLMDFVDDKNLRIAKENASDFMMLLSKNLDHNDEDIYLNDQDLHIKKEQHFPNEIKNIYVKNENSEKKDIFDVFSHKKDGQSFIWKKSEEHQFQIDDNNLKHNISNETKEDVFHDPKIVFNKNIDHSQVKDKISKEFIEFNKIHKNIDFIPKDENHKNDLILDVMKRENHSLTVLNPDQLIQNDNNHSNVKNSIENLNKEGLENIQKNNSLSVDLENGMYPISNESGKIEYFMHNNHEYLDPNLDNKMNMQIAIDKLTHFIEDHLQSKDFLILNDSGLSLGFTDDYLGKIQISVNHMNKENKDLSSMSFEKHNQLANDISLKINVDSSESFHLFRSEHKNIVKQLEGKGISIASLEIIEGNFSDIMKNTSVKGVPLNSDNLNKTADNAVFNTFDQSQKKSSNAYSFDKESNRIGSLSKMGLQNDYISRSKLNAYNEKVDQKHNDFQLHLKSNYKNNDSFQNIQNMNILANDLHKNYLKDSMVTNQGYVRDLNKSEKNLNLNDALFSNDNTSQDLSHDKNSLYQQSQNQRKFLESQWANKIKSYQKMSA